MKIESKQSYAIVSTTIRDINNREMRQMYELKNRINDVLASHKPDSKEKKYISDDDLKLTHAILSVFTKEYESTQTSAFDDFLKEVDAALLKEAEEQLKQQTDEDE
jgi:hypothetical protein